MADNNKKRIQTDLDAADEFTTDVAGTTQASSGTSGVSLGGVFVMTLSGTWSGTLTVQRSSDGGTTWVDVTDNNGTAKAFTTNGTYMNEEPVREVKYRVGFKSGNYTSGTVTVVWEQ